MALTSHLLPIEQQAETMFTNDNGLNALHISIMCGHPNVTQLLLKIDSGLVNMPTQDENKFAPLHLAVMESQPKIVSLLLLDFGADVDATD